MNKGDMVYTIYSLSNDIYAEGISLPFPSFWQGSKYSLGPH